MKALTHQVSKAKTLVRKLKLYGLVLFAGEVRSGKTAAFILAATTITPKHIVITKKGAIDGVKKFTNNVTNYHQVGKLKPEYDLVVLDECFVKGTLVDGTPIEDIKVGDLIRSYNEVTKQIEFKKVTNIFKKERKEQLVKVKFNNNVIQCTTSHLFMTKNHGWVKAKDLTNEHEILWEGK